jgi:hypothetical protein
MDTRHKIDIGLGVAAIAMSLFAKEFVPSGWTTHLIWGRGENARIPKLVGRAFYFILGALLIYWGIFK